MMFRRSITSLILAVAIVGGCASDSTQRSTPSGHADNQRSTGRGPKVKPTKEEPPSVTFSLCAEGLPTTGQWKGDPLFVDINKDGFLDLASLPRLEDGPHVWLGNGKGQWKDSSTGLSKKHPPSCGGGISFNDVNRDGNLDLISGDHCLGSSVYLGDGSGRWEMVAEKIHPKELIQPNREPNAYVGMEDVATADLNGDGFIDIATASSDQAGVNVFLGDGTGRNWVWSSNGLKTSGWANRVLIADMNGDDVPDIVASHSDGPRVWLNDGQGNWKEGSTGLPTPVIHGLFTGIAVGDINEDGRTDIATANWVDGPETYFQKADGSWDRGPDVFPDLRGGSIGLNMGDLDRDGHLDIVVAGKMGEDSAGFVRGVYALRGDGRGQFKFMHRSGLPETGLSATVGIGLADFNNDGTLDVAAGSGLTVESSPDGPREPTIPQRLLVWCTHLPAREVSLTKAPTK